MAKNKQRKEREVAVLEDYLAKAKSVVFTSYNGLTVSKMQDLRRKLRAESSVYLACKKTLLSKAISKNPEIAANLYCLTGSIGLAFGLADEIAPAKTLSAFMKENDNLNIQCGILNSVFLNQAEVIALAQLPGKHELISKVVWTINAPLSGLVNVLAGNIRGLVSVLNAISQIKN